MPIRVPSKSRFPNSTETADFGSYDTRTIDKDITAVMAVTFRVD
jgi:hypothetical protein